MSSDTSTNYTRYTYDTYAMASSLRLQLNVIASTFLTPSCASLSGTYFSGASPAVTLGGAWISASVACGSSFLKTLDRLGRGMMKINAEAKNVSSGMRAWGDLIRSNTRGPDRIFLSSGSSSNYAKSGPLPAKGAMDASLAEARHSRACEGHLASQR